LFLLNNWCCRLANYLFCRMQPKCAHFRIIRFASSKTYCRKKGIQFVAIDQKFPLSDQGPFDVILHKLTGKEWQRRLEEYRETHPEVTVLDPPGAIEHLLNRQSMLQEVSKLDLSDCHGNFWYHLVSLVWK